MTRRHLRWVRRPDVTCASVQEEISARLDGEKGHVSERDLVRHLGQCHRCRRFETAWQAPDSPLVQLVRSSRLTPALAPPPVWTQWADTGGVRTGAGWRGRPSLNVAATTRWLVAAVPAAAIVIALNAGMLGHHNRPATPHSPGICAHRPAGLWLSPEVVATKG